MLRTPRVLVFVMFLHGIEFIVSPDEKMTIRFRRVHANTSKEEKGEQKNKTTHQGNDHDYGHDQEDTGASLQAYRSILSMLMAEETKHSCAHGFHIHSCRTIAFQL